MLRAAARLGRRIRRRLAQEHGFTIIEVLAATVILVAGLTTLFQLLITADHSISMTRLRQEETSLAREALEDSRGLAYTQLNPASIASGLQSVIPGATLSGSNLVVTRAIGSSPGVNYSFNVSFTACSLDDPSDGYGNHNNPPASGGSWCPDVAPNGTTDSNPDDYKRVSVTVSPTNRATPVVQQTILIYARPLNGPAVSCLSTTASCPGSNVTVTSGTSLTFNVTTTAVADHIEWLVNGSLPPSAQVGGGGFDPYAPGGTSSTFNWVFPIPDGSYTITAIAYDVNGNAGSSSTLQVNLNRHQVIAPTSLNAGWNDLIGGVDVQWVPSVDKDVLYYHVYRVYNGGAATLVATCGNVTGTSCADTPESLLAPPIPSARPNPCTSSSQSYTKTDYYYVVGVDTNPSTGLPRESTAQSPEVDANLCDHAPNAPTLSGNASGGQVNLSWTAATDPDTWDQITEYRVYRWPSSRGAQYPGDRYENVGTSTSYSDASPDPGGVTQSYCVTAVDTHLDESPCSNVVTS